MSIVCDFCQCDGATKDDFYILASSTQRHICELCIARCQKIIDERKAAQASTTGIEVGKAE